MDELFKLTAGLEEDLLKFKEETERFKAGDLPEEAYRALRVPRGIYEQREDGTYMVRVRLPAGLLLPHQMLALAAVARDQGNGPLHVTTRQDIQVHRVSLDNLHAVLEALHRAGLSSLGGGGNTVRNITACHDAGVCPTEAFNVTPYAVALTEFFLSDPAARRLPRKFKIGFSGCEKDCCGASVQDVGFIAKRRDGVSGFAVYAGGGMGAHSRVADLLEEFVAADRANLVAEAVKRVFNRHGNRKDRHRARLRFLIEEIGFPEFRERTAAETAQLEITGVAPLAARDIPVRKSPAPGNGHTPNPEFRVWRARYVVPQKQPGYHLVHIPLMLGDISGETLGALADVAAAHGERMVRATNRQNLVIRWVHDNELIGLHERLSALGLAAVCPPIVSNLVACAGAATCRLGICLSRGLARAIADELTHSLQDPDAFAGLAINISGCPNACGRHPVGDIGLHGAARRVHGRLAPHYVVQLGGRVSEGAARLAEGTQTVPARNIPAFVAAFLETFRGAPEFPDFDRFLASGGRDIAARLLDRLAPVPPFEVDKNFYYDWGAETPFSLEGRGPGECGAGVFDLIEVDLLSARDALERGDLYEAVVHAARSLLVTRGVEARTPVEALTLFEEYFLDAGIVDGSFRGLIAAALRLAVHPEAGALADNRKEIAELVETMKRLYGSLDTTLQIGPAAGMPAAAQIPKDTPAAAEIHIDREADFRGVACPLNYVKTKLLLEQMAGGEVLSVLLNKEGARNVPESVASDGCEVLGVKKADGHWQVIIRKSP